MQQSIDNPGGGSAVAIRIVGEAHLLVCGAVIQQTRRTRNQQLRIRADQLYRAGFNRLWALCGIAGNQYRLPQRRCSCTPPESVMIKSARRIK
jgi:hypothetical protein